MPMPGVLGKHGDLYIIVDVSIRPAERSLFMAEGRALLVPLFQEKVRSHSCSDDSIQKDIYLQPQ
jgi:hypothetical protein